MDVKSCLNVGSTLTSTIMTLIGRISSAFPVLAEDALSRLVDLADSSSRFLYISSNLNDVYLFLIDAKEEQLQIQLAAKALSSVVSLQ